jgi:hypothetical protein
MAFDTSGFNLTVPQAPIVTPSLANLAPLNIGAPGLAWKPAEIKTPSSAVAEGIAVGLGALGKGITAAYQSKREDERFKAEQALKQQEIAATQAQRQATLGMEQSRLGMEQSRLDIEAQKAQDEKAYREGLLRVREAGGNKGTPFVDAPTQTTPPLSGITAPTPDSGSSDLDEEVYRQFPSMRPVPGEEPDITQPLNSPDKPMDIGVPAEKLETQPSPLSSLSAPVSPTAMNALGPAVSIPDLSSVSATYLSAGGAAPTSPLAGIPPLSATSAMLQKAKGFGAESIPEQYAVEKQLAAFPSEQESAAISSGPMPGPYKSLASAQAEAAKSYNGYEPNGTIKYDHTIGGYVVERPALKQETIESQANRKQQAEERIGLTRQRLLDSEGSKFYQHPAVKAFTAPNGMQQSFARFVKDYEAIRKNPEASGISDIGLLDMFGRAEGGGRITEGQAALALQSAGIRDKPELLLQKLQGGARLTQNQRDQMLRVISEDHAAQAKIANQAVTFYRNKLGKQGITNEEDLPQYFITPVSKEDAMANLNEMRSEALKIKAQKDAAAQKGDEKSVSELTSKLEDLGKQAKDLSGKLHAAKGTIINMDEIENMPQGWGGGAMMSIPTAPAAQ